MQFTGLTLAILGLMLGLMTLHVPIGFSMGVAGVVGVAAILGWGPALALPQSVLVDVLTNSDLATIPLFLLMGNLAAASGLSQDLYRLANAVVGRFRGGLAMATVAGCGGFGAICGNSIATASTFMRIAAPEMIGRGYKPTIALGSIAAGGTLGILIPAIDPHGDLWRIDGTIRHRAFHSRSGARPSCPFTVYPDHHHLDIYASAGCACRRSAGQRRVAAGLPGSP